MTQANGQCAIGHPDAQRRDLADHGHLLVRRAIDRDDWISEAIFDLAAAGKSEWTKPEWDALLAELAGSPLRISEWLIYYT